MRAINHAITGAIIGLAVTNPVALPLAFASHYVLDSLPHHGFNGESFPNLKLFNVLLAVDILLCVALVAVLSIRHPEYWRLAALCAFLAASPDFMWLSDFRRTLKGRSAQNINNRHAAVRLHHYVQWFQRPIGLIVEVAWVIGATVVLVTLLYQR